MLTNKTIKIIRLLVFSFLIIFTLFSCDVIKTIFGGLDDLGDATNSFIPDAPTDDEADYIEIDVTIDDADFVHTNSIGVSTIVGSQGFNEGGLSCKENLIIINENSYELYRCSCKRDLYNQEEWFEFKFYCEQGSGNCFVDVWYELKNDLGKSFKILAESIPYLKTNMWGASVYEITGYGEQSACANIVELTYTVPDGHMLNYCTEQNTFARISVKIHWDESSL